MVLNIEFNLYVYLQDLPRKKNKFDCALLSIVHKLLKTTQYYITFALLAAVSFKVIIFILTVLLMKTSVPVV